MAHALDEGYFPRDVFAFQRGHRLLAGIWRQYPFVADHFGECGHADTVACDSVFEDPTRLGRCQ